ncbi:MAG TPA: type II toxin-antitoxin system RelE/ParE family toxin [archaeon]|nr:type II toxin-antitoxin system RelE/ParE family toxin [archaeon]
MFTVEYSNQALKFFKRIDNVLAQRILKKIEDLRINPFPQEVKMIEGYAEKTYRVRVGDYRILYEVDQNKNFIGIVKIDNRGRVY